MVCLVTPTAFASSSCFISHSIRAIAEAGQLPLISNTATHCHPGTEACATLEVVSINSDDPALNRLADELLGAKEHRFDKAGLEQWLGEDGMMPDKPEGKIPDDEKNFYTYSYDYLISQTGESKHYRLLNRGENVFTGGAHGMYGNSYYLVSKSPEPRVIPLEEILLPGQRPTLDKLQEAAWKRYLKEGPKGSEDPGFSDEEIAEHLKSFPFTATDNWRLDSKGLVFLFQPYEIAPWAMGMPEILVPAAELKGVVKPEILAEMASWVQSSPDEGAKPEERPQWRGQ